MHNFRTYIVDAWGDVHEKTRRRRRKMVEVPLYLEQIRGCYILHGLEFDHECGFRENLSDHVESYGSDMGGVVENGHNHLGLYGHVKIRAKFVRDRVLIDGLGVSWAERAEHGAYCTFETRVDTHSLVVRVSFEASRVTSFGRRCTRF